MWFNQIFITLMSVWPWFSFVCMCVCMHMQIYEHNHLSSSVHRIAILYEMRYFIIYSEFCAPCIKNVILERLIHGCVTDARLTCSSMLLLICLLQLPRHPPHGS